MELSAAGREARAIVWWIVASATLLLALLIKEFSGSGDVSRAVALALLYSCCSFPIIVHATKPHMRLLALFSLMYFAVFGAYDLIGAFVSTEARLFEATRTVQRTTLADVVIIGGFIAFCVGYRFTSRYAVSTKVVEVWKPQPVLIIGVATWVIGICCYFVVHFIYGVEGPKSIGLLSLLVSNLFYLALVGPALLVVSGLQNSAQKTIWIWIAIMISVEFALGFVGNQKEVSYRIFAMLIVAQFFIRGRLNTKLLATVILLFIPYLAAFQIYRQQVIQTEQRDILEAAASIGESAATIKSGLEDSSNALALSAMGMMERVDCRKYIEIITQRVGHDVPYQNGETLLRLVYSFVPRILWHEKPQISTGQLMNQTFQLSDSPATFVPSTLLGEFYWNFGLAGAIGGMLMFGLFMGYLSRRIAGGQASTESVLLILVSAYFLVARFEGSFGSQFGQLARVVALLLVMSRIFSSLGWTSRVPTSPTKTTERWKPPENILR